MSDYMDILPNAARDLVSYVCSDPQDLLESEIPGLWKGMRATWLCVEGPTSRLHWDIFKAMHAPYGVRQYCMDLCAALMHLEHLVTGWKYDTIRQTDVSELLEKDESYGGSWKKRGGCGAFMMLARKWDRLEKQLGESDDVAKTLWVDNATNVRDGVMDDIRDLRRYLLLCESYVRTVNSRTEYHI